MTHVLPDIAARIAHQGYAFLPGEEMRVLLEREGLRDWAAFAASWNDLGIDTYMADGGRYRRRRHATLRVTADAIMRLPHQPHYQSRDYNALNGGIARWFEPVTEAVAGGPAMRAVLAFCRRLFGGLAAAPGWRVELHQFRIEARAGQEGRPTPEGAHRDGVDYVLVLLVARDNIAEGVTTIQDGAGDGLGSFTLARPLDTVLVDDRRVFHGVTPVAPLDPARPAHRDVLVVTFRRE